MKMAEMPLCEKCGDTAVLVHHIKPEREYPMEALVWENVMALCEKCHDNIHGNRFKLKT